MTVKKSIEFGIPQQHLLTQNLSISCHCSYSIIWTQDIYDIEYNNMYSDNRLQKMNSLLLAMRCETCTNRNTECKCKCSHEEGLCKCEDCLSCRNKELKSSQENSDA